MPAFKRVKRSTGGKPIELTEDLINNICKSMRAGAYIETAAAFAGIHKDTLFSWLKKGRLEPDSIYGELISAVDQAMAECILRDLKIIDRCAQGQKAKYKKDRSGKLLLTGKGNPILLEPYLPPDWAASAWRLERRHSAQWSRFQKLSVETDDPPPEETAEQKADRLARLKEKIKKFQSLDD